MQIKFPTRDEEMEKDNVVINNNAKKINIIKLSQKNIIENEKLKFIDKFNTNLNFFKNLENN